MIYRCYDIRTMTPKRSQSSADRNGPAGQRGMWSPAFLLAQVGAHAAAKFAERLGPLQLTPAHAGSLRIIAASEGASQQEVADRLGMFPSRLVALVDELQERGLVKRVENARDRRVYSLFLTAEGKDVLERIGRVAREHQDGLLASLNATEREQLASLLRKIAEDQGLRAGVHPGFAQLRARRGQALRPRAVSETPK
jgi:DNA-binding MarR family transcriptional regulator